MFYAGYGSNLNISQMRERCPKAKPLEARVLENWQLCFKGVADILPSEGSIVNVGVYKITKECENALDYYEDYPNLYSKKYLSLDGYNKPILTYVMNSGYGIGPPSTLYFNVIKDGYKDWSIKINNLLEVAKKSLHRGEHEPYRSLRWKGTQLVTEEFLHAEEISQ